MVMLAIGVILLVFMSPAVRFATAEGNEGISQLVWLYIMISFIVGILLIVSGIFITG
jgi:hypothetical protein